MIRVYNVLNSIIAFYLMLLPASAANFLQYEGQNGFMGAPAVAVNLSNGAVTVCPTLSNQVGTAPIGKCTKIGILDITGVAGLASNVVISGGSGPTVIIVNIVSGSLLKCSLGVNGQTGSQLGACKADHAF